ncbi:MAG TPA: sigma 54-interacting transcriptional regulator [Labilithrix sp.]|nr:sigma 54-interacting transcriptional regulator [Labilithrix sp.]
MLTLAEPELELCERFHDGAAGALELEHPVLARWARARALAGVTVPGPLAEADLLARRHRSAPIFARSEGLLNETATELRRRGFALLLADDDGVILSTHGVDVLEDPGVRAGLVEGARWTEADRGTNGIGTAIAEGTAVVVVGRAHYDARAHGLVCYAAPIHDAYGQLAGVLDVSGPVGGADPLLAVVVQSVAATIESALREHAALSSLQAAGRRPGGRLSLPSSRDAASSFAPIVGVDPVLVEARRRAARFAPSSLPVLLLAETGTGKELMAQAIHAASDRAHGPFVAVNCGAIPETLLESELFGYAPGAFTGARARGNEGKVGAASGGTLFLDEIAEMSPALQAMMLRVLEDGTYSRVGDARELRSTFRLVCATCKDLETLVDQGLFRSDLYYRIQGVALTLPPLRDRTDSATLAQHLLEALALEIGAPCPRLTDAAAHSIAARPWPGNVRELKTALRYALVMAEGADRIDVAHLPPLPARASRAAPGGASAGRSVAAAEGEALRRALAETNGNLTSAARVLGVARSTLYRMLSRHGLTP